MHLHSHTPSLIAFDARALPVRQIALFRANVQADIEPRITCRRWDQAGRVASITDPRRVESHPSTVYSLTGLRLLVESADAGWRIELPGEAGQVLVGWDERGRQLSSRYDESLRPTQLAEQLAGQAQTVIERCTYGDASQQAANHNQCGRLVRRDDGSGSLDIADYGVSDTVLRQQRRFLAALDIPDWPEDAVQRDRLLGGEAYLTTTAFNALAETIGQRDAQGNRQARGHTIAGQLERVTLQSGERKQVQTLVSDIRYNASAAVESETCGNGVVSRSFYDPQDGRLTRVLAMSPDGHGLQDQNYAYDPVGNVVSLEDATLPVSFFRNQKVEPVDRYVYDSLYQLIEATGREVAPASHLPGMPDLHPLPLDPAKLSHYIQRFEYDAGGNLLTRHHSGAETRRMAVSSTSNRSLPQRADGSLPDDDQIAEAFDGNGNLKALQPGQAMTWDARNQLSEVTSVKRDQEPDDCELYRYDGEGQRVRKVRVNQARSRTLTAEVRYLPGLEIHRNDATGEVRHVLIVEAGRNSVRLLHWESGKPDGIGNDQLRYSLTDHLGSSSLELDQYAQLISHEGYYPFGGTAWWAGRSAVEATYKTVRYSGKARDATGLYYYGFRYYAPWMQRWVNPDPAGDVQGLNRYAFVGNSPLTNKESDGRVYEGLNDKYEQTEAVIGNVIHWRGLSQFPTTVDDKVRNSFAEVNQMFVNAQTMLSNHPRESQPILENYFGAEWPEVFVAVKHTFAAISDLALKYASDWGMDKAVGIVPKNPDESAHVYQRDPHGRIFINVRQIPRSDLALFLGHELSHLIKINRYGVSEPSGSLDHFYLWETGVATMKDKQGNSIALKQQGVSDHIVSGGLTIGYLYQHRSFYGQFFKRVEVLNGGAPLRGVGGALEAFNKYPIIAARMAVENADSLTYAALSLHLEYQRIRRSRETRQ
ncbi:RHS repeat protein [Pseudomonas sp. GD03842]|uniref:RHS repeat domain-containing protein n=1 Tax=Pseudomonas sp. GD03842 TaxID=2975385 RepID=UPI00244AA850|nr:RHS repeat-associated core domain-containing protein [Pseudomonas sp. GD03842]MDH0749714.1 RHS repeat protein [Pseudomonas sp. GD03842]